jgi:hypothetical protein
MRNRHVVLSVGVLPIQVITIFALLAGGIRSVFSLLTGEPLKIEQEKSRVRVARMQCYVGKEFMTA